MGFLKDIDLGNIRTPGPEAWEDQWLEILSSVGNKSLRLELVAMETLGFSSERGGLWGIGV